MTAKPLISVALCTYNGARFLREQLESLLAQEYAPLEIVAVDDGSTDGTLAILEEYARRDGRLQVHRNPTNLGFRKNFEKVVGLCRGELIATCDQDDIWLPAKLSVLQQALGDAMLAYADSELVTEAGHATGLRASSKLRMYEGSDPKVFVFHNCVSGHAMLFRRELLAAALPFPAIGFHDWWLAFVAASVGRIRYVDRPLVKYRQHEQAQTSMIGGGRPAGAPRHAPATGDWLGALQGYERCPERALLQRLHAAWNSRDDRYFTPDLFGLIYANRDSLFYLRRESALARFLKSLRYLWGSKLKRIFRPRRYSTA